MPVPKAKEKEKDFISRCIPFVIHEGTTDDAKQASAICYSIWRKAKGIKQSKNIERVLLHFSANIKPNLIHLEDESKQKIGFDRSTILVGGKVFNGIYFPMDEVERGFRSFDKQPINLNHSDLVEDIVGYVKEPFFDKKDNKLSVVPVFDDTTSKYSVAMGYINTRIAAGATPEVSVGMWLDKVPVEEKRDDGAIFIARNYEGDHLALVTRGACSPEDGCGIGMSKEEPIPIVANNKATIEYDINEDEYRKNLIKKIKHLGGKL